MPFQSARYPAAAHKSDASQSRQRSLTFDTRRKIGHENISTLTGTFGQHALCAGSAHHAQGLHCFCHLASFEWNAQPRRMRVVLRPRVPQAAGRNAQCGAIHTRRTHDNRGRVDGDSSGARSGSFTSSGVVHFLSISKCYCEVQCSKKSSPDAAASLSPNHTCCSARSKLTPQRKCRAMRITARCMTAGRVRRRNRKQLRRTCLRSFASLTADGAKAVWREFVVSVQVGVR